MGLPTSINIISVFASAIDNQHYNTIYIADLKIGTTRSLSTQKGN